MASRRPVLAVAWISILFLVYLNLQVLMPGAPNRVQIIYQNKKDNNKIDNNDRTLETNLKMEIDPSKNNSRPIGYNLHTGSDDKIIDNASGRLSEYELLFKSELKSDEHEKQIHKENELPRANDKPGTKFSKEPLGLDSKPDFRPQVEVDSGKPSNNNAQQKLNSLEAMPLLKALGGMIGGQGSSNNIISGVLGLLSPAGSKEKSSSNGIVNIASGLLYPNSITSNIVNKYVESKLSQTTFLKGLFGNKNYKSSSVLGSKEVDEKGFKGSILGGAGELVSSLFGSSYKDYFKKLQQGWDELFFEIQPPNLGIHEEVQPSGSPLEPREEVIERGESEQHQLQEEEQDLAGCSCTRRLPVKRDLGETILRRRGANGEILTRTISRISTCSNTATLRGPKQKVVSYTYYGDISNPGINNRYFSEIKNRAEEVARLYPGWVMRVYHNITTSNTQGQQQLCEVVCQQQHVDLCSIYNLPSPFGDISHKLETATLWRFLPLLDPLVNIMVSRDLDSYILPREVAAVTAWLSSSRLYHAMRDHPLHGTSMLAGLWGAHPSLNRVDVYQSIATMLSQVPNHDWGYDQFLLRKVLWPTAQNNVLVHDSYFCDLPAMLGRYPTAAFPTQREGRNYTGFGKTKLSVTKSLKPCPNSCRPNDHKDWEYC